MDMLRVGHVVNRAMLARSGQYIRSHATVGVSFEYVLISFEYVLVRLR